MNKLAYFILVAFIINIFSVSAIPLTIIKDTGSSVIVSELNNPVVFNLTFINSGEDDVVEIYSLVGVTLSPRGLVDVPKGTSSIQLWAYPTPEVKKLEGYFSFEFEIKSNNYGVISERLKFMIIKLKDSLQITPQNINYGDNTAKVTVKNLKNAQLDNLKINFKSLFYNSDETISLKPYEEIVVSIPIDASAVKTIQSGSYVVNSLISAGDAEIKFDGVLNYLEKEDVSEVREAGGFIIRKTTIIKTNEGNTPTLAKIEDKQDIISRLFSSFSIEPISVKRDSLSVNYVWEKQINPGESFSVSTTVNYTLPFIIVILIIFIAIAMKIYTNTSLNIKKTVTFVKTRGGEFALKVRLNISTKKYIDNLQIIDRLPGMTKIYEQFGTKPDKIEEGTRRLFWNIPRLNAGEERVISYIIYSKLKIVGTFELPAAIAIFEREGKTEEIWSNKAFFMSETTSTEED